MPAMVPLAVVLTMIEFIVIAAFLREDPLHVLGAVLLGNIITGVAGSYLQNYLGVHPDWIDFGTVIVEGLVICAVIQIDWLRATGLSLLANVVAIFVKVILD